jgi:CBS domain containing-hemolysin-like protein
MDAAAGWPALGWWALAAPAIAALLYWALTLALGARHALGRLAAARVLEERGFRQLLDPGTRIWSSIELARQLAFAGVPLLALLAPERPIEVALVASLVAIVLARVVADIIAPWLGEAALTGLAPLLRVVGTLAGPFVAPLDLARVRLAPTTNAENGEIDEDVREEQIEEVIRDAEEGGLLEHDQGLLFREIVDLGDAVVRDVMTPRTEIAAIEAHATHEEAARVMIRTMHSRLPVYEENLDRVVGVVSVREVLPHTIAGAEPVPVRTIMRSVPLVPWTKNALELLRELQEERQQMAVVVDEYGGTAGIATIEDVVEEIVGEIRDEHEVDDEALQPDGRGGYIADGLLSVEDLEELVEREIPSEGVGTVGGLVFSTLGRIPRLGETIEIQPGLLIQVTGMRGRRIARVRITLRSVEAETKDPPAARRRAEQASSAEKTETATGSDTDAGAGTGTGSDAERGSR